MDLNRADADDLRRLPGIGPVLAERIVLDPARARSVLARRGPPDGARHRPAALRAPAAASHARRAGRSRGGPPRRMQFARMARPTACRFCFSREPPPSDNPSGPKAFARSHAHSRVHARIERFAHGGHLRSAWRARSRAHPGRHQAHPNPGNRRAGRHRTEAARSPAHRRELRWSRPPSSRRARAAR